MDRMLGQNWLACDFKYVHSWFQLVEFIYVFIKMKSLCSVIRTQIVLFIQTSMIFDVC